MDRFFCKRILYETKTQILTLERSKGGGGGYGGGQIEPAPKVFPTKKLKLRSNQNEIFSTCNLIMIASFDVNWMMSSFVIYEKFE